MKCPRCGNEYDELLSLSRIDNKTMICDECGIAEAIEDYLGGIEALSIINEKLFDIAGV